VSRGWRKKPHRKAITFAGVTSPHYSPSPSISPERTRGEREREKVEPRLREMAEVYRYREALYEKLHRDSGLKRSERSELAGECRAYGLVANEIDALLGRPLPPRSEQG
jgi:hypothetical protein